MQSQVHQNFVNEKGAFFRHIASRFIANRMNDICDLEILARLLLGNSVRGFGI